VFDLYFWEFGKASHVEELQRAVAGGHAVPRERLQAIERAHQQRFYFWCQESLHSLNQKASGQAKLLSLYFSWRGLSDAGLHALSPTRLCVDPSTLELFRRDLQARHKARVEQLLAAGSSVLWIDNFNRQAGFGLPKLRNTQDSSAGGSSSSTDTFLDLALTVMGLHSSQQLQQHDLALVRGPDSLTLPAVPLNLFAASLLAPILRALLGVPSSIPSFLAALCTVGDVRSLPLLPAVLAEDDEAAHQELRQSSGSLENFLPAGFAQANPGSDAGLIKIMSAVAAMVQRRRVPEYQLVLLDQNLFTRWLKVVLLSFTLSFSLSLSLLPPLSPPSLSPPLYLSLLFLLSSSLSLPLIPSSSSSLLKGCMHLRVCVCVLCFALCVFCVRARV
jgi:hypothetical protein